MELGESILEMLIIVQFQKLSPRALNISIYKMIFTFVLYSCET